MAKLPTFQAALDGLRHAALLFAADGRLLHANLAAGTLLSTDLHMLRSEGWPAAVALFSVEEDSVEVNLNDIRQKAFASDRPVPFHTLRTGEYVPCTASAIASEDGEVQILIVMDDVAWGVVGSVLDHFKSEMGETVNATIGHISLINRTLEGNHAEPATNKLARRISGFGTLIAMHMRRAARLMYLMERLENLRTGKTRRTLTAVRQPVMLADFMEDFLQSLDENELLDPETDNHDYRSRIVVDIPPDLGVASHRAALGDALHELLRNAIMYSMRGTPVTIKATARGNQVQIDIIDEGYGIRAADHDRVFKLFERGKNPQIMSEFGYGLAMYLVKHEIALMNGKLWFNSVENVSTTFSILLPLAVESSAAESA